MRKEKNMLLSQNVHTQFYNTFLLHHIFDKFNSQSLSLITVFNKRQQNSECINSAIMLPKFCFRKKKKYKFN